jgi:hypothetical protein
MLRLLVIEYIWLWQMQHGLQGEGVGKTVVAAEVAAITGSK